jgi:hypothetical protein
MEEEEEAGEAGRSFIGTTSRRSLRFLVRPAHCHNRGRGAPTLVALTTLPSMSLALNPPVARDRATTAVEEP